MLYSESQGPTKSLRRKAKELRVNLSSQHQPKRTRTEGTCCCFLWNIEPRKLIGAAHADVNTEKYSVKEQDGVVDEDWAARQELEALIDAVFGEEPQEGLERVDYQVVGRFHSDFSGLDTDSRRRRVDCELPCRVRLEGTNVAEGIRALGRQDLNCS